MANYNPSQIRDTLGYSLDDLRTKGWMNCDTPITRNPHGQRSFGVCGKCARCVKRRQAQWIGKILLETAWNEMLYGPGSAVFLTLTYNDENLGPSKHQKRDLQLFLKRFRTNTQKSVRYFAVGEYGKKFGRKHWHLILWGPDILRKISKLGPDAFKTEGKLRTYHATLDEQLSEAWGHGFVHVRSLIPQRVAYAVKYVTKSSSEAEPSVLFSLKPGLGAHMLKHMMYQLAKAKPSLQRLPATYQIGKRRYSMNPSQFQRAKQFYVDGGGQIILEQTPTLRAIQCDFSIGWRPEIERRMSVAAKQKKKAKRPPS